MKSIKRVTGLAVQFGGEEHSGWLPPGAAKPLPTPIVNAVLDVEIVFDGFGFLLCWRSRDGFYANDTWHETLAEAERCATERFGIECQDWIDA